MELRAVTQQGTSTVLVIRSSAIHDCAARGVMKTKRCESALCVRGSAGRASTKAFTWIEKWKTELSKLASLTWYKKTNKTKQILQHCSLFDQHFWVRSRKKLNLSFLRCFIWFLFDPLWPRVSDCWAKQTSSHRVYWIHFFELINDVL